MIVINSLPPITLYNASMKFYHAAKLIDENAGRVMAEVMEEWAYEFLDMMKMLAEAGGIPANPALSTWTLALSNGKQYTYDTGEFWASMEVRTRHLKNWAEVTIKPTGYSSHSFGPRRSHLFPMTHLMAALGHTEDNEENPEYQVIIDDPVKVHNIMKYLYWRAPWVEGMPAPDEQQGTGEDEKKKKKALVIKVPHRPIIPMEIWDDALEDLAKRIHESLKTELTMVLFR